MDKKRSLAIQYWIILLLAVSIAALMTYIYFQSDYNLDVSFAPDNAVCDNPLMGFAPDATNESSAKESRLVYITLTWHDWEPKEGEFATDWLEKQCHIEEWKKEQKHAIIRFVCDVPENYDHRDIPEWLYKKTQSGTAYTNELGRGYSPNYADPVFLKYHEKALRKLAEYCNKDHFVSFVEMGSLGHMGTWKAYDGNGKDLMPDHETCMAYASLYSNSFTEARLLAAENYDFAVDGNIGVFGAEPGNKEATGEMIKRLTGQSGEEEENMTLKASPQFGFVSPVGGNLTGTVSMNELMGDGLGEMLADISAAHMTYVGPTVPGLVSKQGKVAFESVKRRLGYRIYVSRLKTQYNFADDKLQLTLSFKNAGNAGFYFDWPVKLHILDQDKNEIFWQGLDLDMRKLTEDREEKATAYVPVTGEIRDEFYVGISISDYEGKDDLKLAINYDEPAERVGNIQLIYHYVRK
ncbi:MAG: DUF4832 domain-containing protein [Lachnospiraceae bacterium]|nr:DUF4832 domain-containing protein [Lachnospiraceae bacterium]